MISRLLVNTILWACFIDTIIFKIEEINGVKIDLESLIDCAPIGSGSSSGRSMKDVMMQYCRKQHLLMYCCAPAAKKLSDIIDGSDKVFRSRWERANLFEQRRWW